MLVISQRQTKKLRRIGSERSHQERVDVAALKWLLPSPSCSATTRDPAAFPRAGEWHVLE